MVSDNPLATLFQAAWPNAFAEACGLMDELGKPGTPAEEARGKDAKERDARATVMAYAIHHALRLHLVLQGGIATGLVSQSIAAEIIGRATQFTGGVVQQLRAVCTVAPCTWRGGVEQAGPAGICPECGKAPVKLSPLVAVPAQDRPRILTG